MIVKLNLIALRLISSLISPLMRNRYIEESSLPLIHPVFLLLRNSIEDWVFSLQLHLPAVGFSHHICIPVPISITWLTFSVFTESENQKTASPLLQLTLAGNVSPPFPSPMFAGKLCQIQTNSLIITCLFTYALLTVKYSGPFCRPLTHPPFGLNILCFI